MTEPRTHPTEVLRRWMDEPHHPITSATQVIRTVVARTPRWTRARLLQLLRRGGNAAVILGSFVLVLGMLNQAFLPTFLGFTCLAGGFSAFSLELLVDPSRPEHNVGLQEWFKRVTRGRFDRG